MGFPCSLGYDMTPATAYAARPEAVPGDRASDTPGASLYLLAVMAGFGWYLLLAGRSEIIRGVSGRRPRWALPAG
jgi:hypothetical protein